jgi:ribosomal protein L7Ae-like RNA K-turn-binding protein
MHKLKDAADLVEKDLSSYYPGDVVKPLNVKLRSFIAGLKPDPSKKAVAIFVSPVFEKAVFLNSSAPEKIVIDEYFDIRDLLNDLKQIQPFLILVLSSKESHMFLNKRGSLTKLSPAMPESISAYINDAPEKVANFSDAKKRNEIVVEKFLRHIDDALLDVIKAYKIPVFVMGVEKLLGQFNLSKHADSVAGYIEGNFEKATESELKELVKPKLAALQAKKQRKLLEQVEKAEDKGQLAVGLEESLREVKNNKGRLLVVERNYKYPALHGSDDSWNYQAEESDGQLSRMSDAVGDLIEKMLRNGGEVELVEDGMLDKYQHVALVQFY